MCLSCSFMFYLNVSSNCVWSFHLYVQPSPAQLLRSPVCVCVRFHFYPVMSEFLVVVAPIYENKLLRHSFGFYFHKQEAQLWKTQGRKAALTCVWSLRRTHTSPGSPPSLSEACRCRLKRGRGTAGRLSGRNMLAGAGVMMAFVTGPKHTNRKWCRGAQEVLFVDGET